jgi:hypothetical protein
MTVNTSLVRECLELILMLADALDRKQTKPPSTVSRRSLPVAPEVAPVALGSETLEGVRDRRNTSSSSALLAAMRQASSRQQLGRRPTSRLVHHRLCGRSERLARS